MRGSGGISIGGIGDPVAQNIKAEQNSNAMPSSEERHREKKCDHCEERSPDVDRRGFVLASECPAVQMPDRPFELLCDECEAERPTKEEKLDQKVDRKFKSDRLDDPVAIAHFECGDYLIITEPEPEEHAPPGMAAPSTAPIECRCGSPLDKVDHIDRE